jgi:hypothetical protein
MYSLVTVSCKFGLVLSCLNSFGKALESEMCRSCCHNLWQVAHHALLIRLARRRSSQPFSNPLRPVRVLYSFLFLMSRSCSTMSRITSAGRAGAGGRLRRRSGVSRVSLKHLVPLAAADED